jgi:hypothetical protein
VRTTLEEEALYVASDGPEYELVRCPVCGSQGLLERYFHELEPTDEEIDGGDYREINVTVYPDQFDCYVCRLSLNARECAEVPALQAVESLPPSPRDPAEILHFDQLRRFRVRG